MEIENHFHESTRVQQMAAVNTWRFTTLGELTRQIFVLVMFEEAITQMSATGGTLDSKPLRSLPPGGAQPAPLLRADPMVNNP